MAERVVVPVVRFEKHLPTHPEIFLPPACGATRKFLTIPLGHYLQSPLKCKHIASQLFILIHYHISKNLFPMQDNLGQSENIGKISNKEN